MMPFPYQLGQAGLTQKQWAPAISMDFEGSNGSSTFTDDSRFGTTWTRSGANVTISTVQNPKGSSSLLVNGASDYLEASTTSDIILPATADWEMRFLMVLGGAAGKYLLSCIDTSASAAGTQFGFYMSQSNGSGNTSNRVLLFLSDGTTYSQRLQSSTDVVQASVTSIVFGREGSRLYLAVNGALQATASFTGSIPQVSGRKIRIGKPETTGESGPNSIYFDDFRFFR